MIVIVTITKTLALIQYRCRFINFLCEYDELQYRAAQPAQNLIGAPAAEA
jgi:hypothetical protein